MRHPGITIVFVAIALGTLCPGQVSLSAAEPALLRDPRGVPQYVGATQLSGVKIGDQSVPLHSQGLYATKAHFYVTGRLESVPPRALLLRIDRADPRRVAFLDLTSRGAGASRSAGPLDHPGGFDCDGQYLWIPVSESKPRSHTAIVRVPLDGRGAFGDRPHDVAFEVDDHIGALAVDGGSRRLYGANWGTQWIYVWELNGRQLRKTHRRQFIRDDPDWALCVQDWKGLGGGRILAGGLDAHKQAAASGSEAVVELLDADRGACLRRVRLTRRPESEYPMTREGMALAGDVLFLLPGDIVSGGSELGKQGTPGKRESPATIFSYRWAIGRPR